MPEEIESVRKDSAERQIEQKQINDWSGKRVVLPRGTTLPPTGLPAEVFVLVDNSGRDKLYIYDESAGDWSTV